MVTTAAASIAGHSGLSPLNAAYSFNLICYSFCMTSFSIILNCRNVSFFWHFQNKPKLNQTTVKVNALMIKEKSCVLLSGVFLQVVYILLFYFLYVRPGRLFVWSLTNVAWLLVGGTFSDICSTRSPTVFKAAAQLDPDQLTFRHLCDPRLQPKLSQRRTVSRMLAA